MSFSFQFLACRHFFFYFSNFSVFTIKFKDSLVCECDRQFKSKAQQQKMGDDAKWELLVRKVLSAKAMSSLSLPKRKREDELRETMGGGGHVLKTFRFY